MSDEADEVLEGLAPDIARLLKAMMQATPKSLPEARAIRDEIVALHERAENERERTSLLFAFNALMDHVQSAGLLDQDGLDQLKGLRRADYLMMLNSEAMIGDLVDPDRLADITQREVEFGRLNEGDEFRQLAVAGSAVLGKRRPAKQLPGWLGRLIGRR